MSLFVQVRPLVTVRPAFALPPGTPAPPGRRQSVPDVQERGCGEGVDRGEEKGLDEEGLTPEVRSRGLKG